MENKFKKLLIIIAVILVGATVWFFGIQMITGPDNNMAFVAGEIKVDEIGERYFTGNIENRADNPATDILVVMSFLDEEGVVIGSGSAEKQSLAPDEVWSFEIMMPARGVVKYRVDKISWVDESSGEIIQSDDYKPTSI